MFQRVGGMSGTAEEEVGEGERCARAYVCVSACVCLRRRMPRDWRRRFSGKGKRTEGRVPESGCRARNYGGDGRGGGERRMYVCA